jgi:SAM-dependent methyltransferase
MALGRRLDHPSRDHFYAWLAQQARQFAPTLAWCDVGVLSMVDYFNVRQGVKASWANTIVYTGLEISESIAMVARQRLLHPGDRVLVGDIEDPDLPTVLPERFDVICIRHVLNHCRYYEVPLRNAFDLLNPGGKIFVNLHLKCSTDSDIIESRPMHGVPGEYRENIYEFERFLRFFSSLFAVESIVEIDSMRDSRNKPNQIFIGIKPGLPHRAQPQVIQIRPSLVSRLLGLLRRKRGARRAALRPIRCARARVHNPLNRPWRYSRST